MTIFGKRSSVSKTWYRDGTSRSGPRRVEVDVTTSEAYGGVYLFLKDDAGRRLTIRLEQGDILKLLTTALTCQDSQ